MRPFIIFSIILYILSGCKNESDDIKGKWIAINSFEPENPLVYDFKEGFVYTSNAKSQMYKRKWEFYQNQLVIQSKYEGQFEKYKVFSLGTDTLRFKGENDDLILVADDIFFNKARLFLSSEQINSLLINNSWRFEVTGTNNTTPFKKMSVLEFLNDSVLLSFVFDEVTRKYTFSNLVKWSTVSHQKLNLLKLEGTFSNNVFINYFSDSLITGELISAAVDQKGIPLSQKVKIYRVKVDNENVQSLRNILRGEWKNVSGELEPYIKIPNRILFFEEFDKFRILTPDQPENKLNRRPFDINSTAELLLLQNLKPKSYDIIQIKGFSEDTIKLSFPKSILDYTFVKVSNSIKEDEYY